MSEQNAFDEAKAGAFAERLFGAGIAAAELATVYVGDQLGLYRSLSEAGPSTFGELARHSGIHPRYAQEWLEQQAAAGILEVDDASAAAERRRYTLPPEHAAGLVDRDSPFSIAPLATAAIACVKALPSLMEAYRNGGGVAWEDFGREMIEAQGDFNRPWQLLQLGSEYLPALEDVHALLQSGARVADVACGAGWAAIAIAKAYPKARVVGFDVDAYSIELARRNATEAGVADRVSFEVADGAGLATRGPFDLGIIVEAVHDMSRPVEVLAAVREALKPGGSLIVADERVGEAFSAPADEVERLMYAVSILCCLPAGMSEQPSAATGTVIRPGTMRRYAKEAGFKDAAELESIEHPFLRFYRLTA
jgi:2-polyprenyl-3-methyl-5-hydroxy-6-metoxy-1,4-benzoquinol methylase